MTAFLRRSLAARFANAFTLDPMNSSSPARSRFVAVLLTVCIAAASGCSDPGDSLNPQPLSPSDAVSLPVIQFDPEGIPPGYTDADKMEATQLALQQSLPAVVEAETWEHADRSLSERLKGMTDTELFYAQQIAAVQMIQGPLGTAEGFDASEAAAKYAGWLAQHGSPEAVTVLRAVEAFGDEWSDETVKGIIEPILIAHERRATVRRDCVDCDQDERRPPQRLVQSLARERDEAIRRLDREVKSRYVR